ncbi:PDZ and LIM domain protein 7 isoform X4 [Prionailurus viverrinus]|uniref:PDZ and LIM domain protein 7 isoform X4 n=1 Tax=Prionailurus viverrinus TaxID=61388 RepID=UPI001FF27D22|nr:PDZ and LIM domain protein 7 isoform X4 [Prionailurus viverrinus]
MDSFKVVLEGPAPWGFRLQGGKDFNVPLSISRLTPGGKASQAGVAVGDWVLSIDGENAGGLTHIEAQNKIRACGERLSLGLSRAQPAQSKPQKVQTPDKQPLRPLVPDASKQRLMEDTEDWRPRPGTGQSRSFRILAHLTGTEFMQDPDEEHLKKSRSCSQVPRTEAPAPASTTPQEPWPGPTTPSPTSRPPWAVDPAFAERYAPDKTSTVLTRHSQPATPTPLQNRTSIVQAATGGGTGAGGGSNGKTPVCHQCHKVIRGRYLVALGHAYHPEEFVCSQCGKVLEEGGFFEEKGAIFCPPCYDVRYAPSCAKCKKKITGEIMHALKMTWHVHCFTCAACKTPIRNRAFYMEEGAPYCERDYEKMFGTKCRGCDFKIDAGDRFLEALGFSWHDTCFVCANNCPTQNSEAQLGTTSLLPGLDQVKLACFCHLPVEDGGGRLCRRWKRLLRAEEGFRVSPQQGVEMFQEALAMVLTPTQGTSVLRALGNKGARGTGPGVSLEGPCPGSLGLDAASLLPELYLGFL